MLRFKQFMGRGLELEQVVNEWLGEFEPDVTQMMQTVDVEGAVTLSFLFEESFRGQERRLSEEHDTARAARPAMPASSIPDRPIRVPEEPGQPMPRQPRDETELGA